MSSSCSVGLVFLYSFIKVFTTEIKTLSVFFYLQFLFLGKRIGKVQVMCVALYFELAKSELFMHFRCYFAGTFHVDARRSMLALLKGH